MEVTAGDQDCYSRADALPTGQGLSLPCLPDIEERQGAYGIS
jgi:hypothetical protein